MEVKVGGMILEVVSSEMDEFGRFDEEKGKIFVRNGLTANMTARTLLHEIIHAIWCEYDLPKEPIEETCVRRLESGLASFIMDNPALAKQLVRDISSRRATRS